MIDFIKKNKKKIALMALVLVVLIGLTFGYFRATGVNKTTTLSASGGATPQLVFNSGDPVSLTFGQSDFGSGASNKVAQTTASATLYTNSSADGASMTYDVYIRLNSNFVYSDGSTPEVILTITDPTGSVVTDDIYTAFDWEQDGCSFNSALGGYDVTEALNGLYGIGNFSISSSSANQALEQNWTFRVTLRNLSANQKKNIGKSFYAQVILVNHGGLDDNIYFGGEALLYNYINSSSYASSYDGSVFNDSLTRPQFITFGFAPYFLCDSTGEEYTQILESNNVLFAGFCWQMIRTTTDGGVKLVYNGEPSNGTCASNRGNHTGVVGGDTTTKDLSGGAYVYGDGFTYSGSTFTLTDTVTKTWNTSTYRDLIGKYTCGTNSSSCTTLYYVGPSDATTGEYSSSSYVVPYIIGMTNYAQIGTSAFNVDGYSPADVGYMYNYRIRKTGSNEVTNAIYGSDVTYANGKYYLKGISTTKDNTHKYSCRSTTETNCTSVYYYYYKKYYVTLSDGRNITEAMHDMLHASDVNKYDSTMKKYLESWYKNKLINYSSFLEDVIWCEDRTVTNETTTGWYPTGNISEGISFTGNGAIDLVCSNEIDQFSMSNPKARIRYPIGMLSWVESSLMGVWQEYDEDYFRQTGHSYWYFSPFGFANDDANMLAISDLGYEMLLGVSESLDDSGVRPSIVLAPGVVVSGGNGSTSTPYRILGDNYSY